MMDDTDDHRAQTDHKSAYRLYRQALDEIAALRCKFEEMREGLELERDVAIRERDEARGELAEITKETTR